MTVFLGVDGGGTKTALCLVSGEGELLASQQTTGAYLAGAPGVGPRHVTQVLQEAVPALCATAGVPVGMVDFAFFGLPAYGELSADQPLLDAAPHAVLGHDRYRCDNDVVCGWAGSLGLADGINVVAGTGSIAYGRHDGASARVGGWGELFGDEGSGYWIGLRALQTFSRISDGRLAASPFADLVRERLGVHADFDLLDVVHHQWGNDRSRIAGLSRLVAEAADAADPHACRIIEDAVGELVALVTAVRDRVRFDGDEPVLVSFSGGVFGATSLRSRFTEELTSGRDAYEVRTPRYTPVIGAALYAAELAGRPLDERALARLDDQLR